MLLFSLLLLLYTCNILFVIFIIIAIVTVIVIAIVIVIIIHIEVDLSIVKATMVSIEAYIRVSVITTFTSQSTCKILI